MVTVMVEYNNYNYSNFKGSFCCEDFVDLNNSYKTKLNKMEGD